MAKVIKRTAFIVDGPINFRTLAEGLERFQMKLYVKEGPTKLGDCLVPASMIEVKAGQMSFEVFSDAATKWVEENFPDAEEVTVRWYPNA